MQRFKVQIKGVSSLIMHRDNVGFAESLKAWQTNPENKGKSVSGDDRSPGWTWLGYVYHNGRIIGIPADNLMTMLREGGARVMTGKGKGTFKRQTQSGIIITETIWPLIVGGKQLDWQPFAELAAVEKFDDHLSMAQAGGFDLLIKRARVGQSKHVRVRPIFDDWSTSGTITVTDDTLDLRTMQRILDCAGDYCGICDWRPSAPKSPGPFGRFEAKVEAA